MTGDAVVLRIYSSNDVPDIHSCVPIYQMAFAASSKEPIILNVSYQPPPSQAADIAIVRPALVSVVQSRPWPTAEHIKNPDNIDQMTKLLWRTTASVPVRTPRAARLTALMGRAML